MSGKHVPKTSCPTRVSVPSMGFCFLEKTRPGKRCSSRISVPSRGFCFLGKHDLEKSCPSRISVPSRGFCFAGISVAAIPTMIVLMCSTPDTECCKGSGGRVERAAVRVLAVPHAHSAMAIASMLFHDHGNCQAATCPASCPNPGRQGMTRGT